MATWIAKNRIGTTLPRNTHSGTIHRSATGSCSDQRQGLQETAWARVIELGNLLVHRGQRGTLRLESPGQPVEQRDPVQQVERAREHAPLVTGEEQQRQGGESEEGAGQERYDDR